MAAQSPSTVRGVPGDQQPQSARQRQAEEATRQGAAAALANQRALGDNIVREARESARPRPNSPAHSPGEQTVS